jgi:hypothetical protein
MVKKYFIIVLLLCILGSGGLWANHIYGYTIGIPVAVLGSGIAIANFVISDGEPSKPVMVASALLVVSGFSWALYDMLTHPKPDEDNVSNYSSHRKMNPIAEHLSFAVMPNRVYVGARLKF